MNNSPLFSSRIFTLAASIAIVLSSLSLLVFSFSFVSPAKAEVNTTPEKPLAPWDAELRGSVGLGIVKDTAYFVVFSNPNLLYKVSLSSAKDWYKN